MPALTLVHVDTCLPDFVLNHCNGPAELLLGVVVERNTRHFEVAAELAREFRATGDKVPEAYTEKDFAVAVADCFEHAHPLACFDRTLEPHGGEDAARKAPSHA